MCAAYLLYLFKLGCFADAPMLFMYIVRPYLSSSRDK